MKRAVLMLLAGLLLTGCARLNEQMACWRSGGLTRPHIPARVAARVHHHMGHDEGPPPPRVLPPSDTGVFPVPTRPVFGPRLDGRELGRLQAGEPIAPPEPTLDNGLPLPAPSPSSPITSASIRTKSVRDLGWKAVPRESSTR